MSGLLGKIVGGLTGGVVGLIGANQVSQKAKGNRGAINRAYLAATQQQSLDQANTRQNTNESLNARGVLAAGSPTMGAGLSPIAQSVAKTGEYRNEYNRAQAGSVGPSNTLGGQVNSNLGDQFYKEQKNTYDEKQGLLNENKAQATNGYISNAMNGVKMYTDIASGNAMGAATDAVNGVSGNAGGAGAASPSMNGPMTGAFGAPANLGPSGSGSSMGDTMGIPQTSVPSTGATGTPTGGSSLSGGSDVANYNFNVG